MKPHYPQPITSSLGGSLDGSTLKSMRIFTPRSRTFYTAPETVLRVAQAIANGQTTSAIAQAHEVNRKFIYRLRKRLQLNAPVRVHLPGVKGLTWIPRCTEVRPL